MVTVLGSSFLSIGNGLKNIYRKYLKKTTRENTIMGEFFFFFFFSRFADVSKLGLMSADQGHELSRGSRVDSLVASRVASYRMWI